MTHRHADPELDNLIDDITVDANDTLAASATRAAAKPHRRGRRSLTNTGRLLSSAI
jgi:hypothetical protein